MSRTRGAVYGPKGSSIEFGGHEFSSNNNDADVLCNLACASMGRHAHIDDCRGDPHDPEAVHINEGIVPNLGQEKDWITHELYWRRMGESVAGSLSEVLLMGLSGFKGSRNQRFDVKFQDLSFSVDPYSREDQANFAKWYVG